MNTEDIPTPEEIKLVAEAAGADCFNYKITFDYGWFMACDLVPFSRELIAFAHFAKHKTLQTLERFGAAWAEISMRFQVIMLESINAYEEACSIIKILAEALKDEV